MMKYLATIGENGVRRKGIRVFLLTVAVFVSMAFSAYAASFDDLRYLRVNSPFDISRIVRERVSYRSDRGAHDSWKAPEVTWRERGGDCEDFALLVHHVSRMHGIDSEIVIAEGEGRRPGHAVVMGIWQSRYWVSSNGGYREFSSRKEAINFIESESGLQRPRVYALSPDSPLIPQTASTSIEYCNIHGDYYVGPERFVGAEGYVDGIVYVDTRLP